MSRTSRTGQALDRVRQAAARLQIEIALVNQPMAAVVPVHLRRVMAAGPGGPTMDP
jgi:hypothetical protein